MLNRENGATIRVVPAIDLLDGHVVRLRQGRYDQVTEYPVDPDRVAATYAEQGATACVRPPMPRRSGVWWATPAWPCRWAAASATKVRSWRRSSWGWRACWWARWRRRSRSSWGGWRETPP